MNAPLVTAPPIGATEPATLLFVGIDPGVSGGIAAVNAAGDVVTVSAMPETERDLLDLLGGLQGARTVLEKVWATPAMGVTSAFTFGSSYGGLRMALVAAGLPFDAVAAATWQKAMGVRQAGRKGLGVAKDKNINKGRAQALFPKVRVTHATADALLLADYCRRMHVGAG